MIWKKVSYLQSAYHFVYQKVLELWVNSGGSGSSGVVSLWLPFLTQVPWNTSLFKCLCARARLKLLSKSRGSYVSLKCWIGSKNMLSGHHWPQVMIPHRIPGSSASRTYDRPQNAQKRWSFIEKFSMKIPCCFREVMCSGSVCSFLLRMKNSTFTAVSLAEHIICGTRHCVPPKRNNIVSWCFGKNIVGID